MAVATKVGSFIGQSTAGTQAVTGLGFTPKAIIFWMSGNLSTSGTWGPNIQSFMGFTAGAASSYCCASTSSDAVATSATARRMAAKAITIVNTAASLVGEADLSSFDADGFTLNWTTATGITPAIMYMAIGGADITGAKVVNWTQPTAVGNKAVTGVGFSPDLVLNATALATTALPQSVAGVFFGFGAMNKAGQQWSNSILSDNGVNPSNTSRFQQTDAAQASVKAIDTLYTQSHFVSMDTDGFTTNFSSVETTVALQMISLCLKGVSSKIGAFAKTTAAAPAAQSITRVGFTPKAVLLSNFNTSALGTPTTFATLTIGASDGANQRTASLTDADNVSPTRAKSIFANDAIAITGDTAAAPTTVRKGSLTSLDSDGFSLNWTVNDASAEENLYLAIGDAGVNTFPSDVSV